MSTSGLIVLKHISDLAPYKGSAASLSDADLISLINQASVWIKIWESNQDSSKRASYRPTREANRGFRAFIALKDELRRRQVLAIL